ncbi:MAG: BamA/TamA family outer membrane protein [Desulfobacteraceae bacterium]|nr:BamA/TamA family outer membrane protein [Desulfobacteraceae bacterium]
MPACGWSFVFARAVWPRATGGRRLSALALLLLLIPAPVLAEASGTPPFAPPGTTAKQGTPAGPWRMTVTGNRALDERGLLHAARAEIDAFSNGGQPASAIDDAAFQMEMAYRHQGYYQAMVDYQIRAAAKTVLFTVREGVRLLVGGIEPRGNRAIATARLLALDAGINEALARHRPFPYVAEEIDDLAGSIRDLYLSEGYLRATAQAEPVTVNETGLNDGHPLTVVIQIKEGRRYTVGDIEVRGEVPDSLGDQIKAITGRLQGRVYQRRLKLLLKTKLRDCLENAGYAEAQVTVNEALDDQTGRARLTAALKPGLPVVVEAIRVQGNERTSRDFIDHRLKLAPGQPYSLKARRESFNALYQTGLFSHVDLHLTDGSAPGRQVLAVTVKERQAREVYVEPGWGSYEMLRLKSGYKDSNILGSGRILRLDSEVSIMGRSLEVGVSDPWFLGTDITASLPFHYRYRIEPAYTLENSGADLYFIKKLPQRLTATLGYQYGKNVVTDIHPDADLQGIESNYETAQISGQLVRDTRDDLFFPTQGYRGNLALALARPYFGGTIAYNRLQTGMRYFRPTPGGGVLALRFNTGFILPTDGQQGIPVSERFFNGGENSVRSFQASKLGPMDASGEPLGGAAFSTYTVEWRKKFTTDLAWSLFYDLGNVSPNRSTVDGQSPLAAGADALMRATWRDYFSDLRSGVGGGLQYMLPVGPARLDLAFNPDRHPARAEPDYVVHFSIGMAF